MNCKVKGWTQSKTEKLKHRVNFVFEFGFDKKIEIWIVFPTYCK